MRFHHKAKLHGKYVVEMVLFEIPKSNRYPLGMKYRLICVDEKSGDRALMDNHHPKGPHVHLDDRELHYDFVNDEKLFDDFEQLVLDHMGVKL